MENINIYKEKVHFGLKRQALSVCGFVVAACMLLLCTAKFAVAQEASAACTYSENGITDTKYYVNGNYVSSSSLRSVTQGTRVKVCFNAPVDPSMYTLVSYKAIEAYFSEANAEMQKLYDYETMSTSGGERVCLEIDVPNCYFQIDFVKGCKIDQLGPAGTDNFYGKQGRLITYGTGGTGVCEDLEGCTLGYWKNHTDRWCATYSPTATTFGSVFSSAPGSLASISLLDALNLRGGGASNLARQGVAALLSACHDEVPTAYTAETVIYIVNRAFQNAATIGAVAEELDRLNNAGCTLEGSRATTSLSTTSELKGVEAIAEDELRAYPVPFAGKTTIRFSTAGDESYSVSLYDGKGSTVRQLKAGTAKAGEVNQVEVDGAGLPDGLYIVRVRSESGVRSVKLLLKKQ